MYRVGPMVELRDLRAVDVLVEELHFGRAASRLGVTPSTLSRRIRMIERDLGVSLFIRTSRTVTLTEAGRELATRLPAALRHLDTALAAARTPQDGDWQV